MELLGLMPDRDVTTPGGFVSCVGYEPTLRGWRLQRALVQVAAAGDPSNLFTEGLVSRTADGTEIVHLAGTGGAYDHSLYRLSGSNLVRCSRTAAYSSSTTHWSFAQWGDLTYATNGLDPVQVRDATGTAAFADASASNIPLARIAFTWGPAPQRMMLLDYDDGSGRVYDGWWSSHQGGPLLDWGPVLADESVNDRLFGAGPLTAGIGYRDTAVMFGADGMWVGTYVGRQALVVDVRKVADVGCANLSSLAVMNGLLYFIGKQGLFVYDGSYPRKLDVPIQQTIIQQLAAGGDIAPSVAVDPARQRLVVTVDRVYSISVLNGKVGELTSDVSLYLNNGYAAQTGSALLRESAAPSTLAAYIQLNPIGDASQLSLLQRVHGRFSYEPLSFAMSHTGLMSLAVPDAANQSIRTKHASPWRIDLVKSARWHSLQLYLGTDGVADPELQSLDVEMRADGSE